METKIDSKRSYVEELRNIRDKTSLDIQDMNFEQLSSYGNIWINGKRYFQNHVGIKLQGRKKHQLLSMQVTKRIVLRQQERER